MKKKSVKVFLIVICLLFAVWAVMFTTDYTRSLSLREPIFAASKSGESGAYTGLGYTVSVEKYTDDEQGGVRCVEMRVFGKLVAASIS